MEFGIGICTVKEAVRIWYRSITPILQEAEIRSITPVLQEAEIKVCELSTKQQARPSDNSLFKKNKHVFETF
jgi:hypothetical protein